ncbi:MAG: retropepsin-like domain-containing protein [Proteobacteria bacterium]|nr:retropepsin-like domain-containing protein [Pseudomonadota bacterium]
MESKMRISLISLLFFISSCSTTPKGEVPMEIPFSYVEQSFILVPLKINDTITGKFVLDTGIGVNLISKSLCERLKCVGKSSHTGKRMSGQELTIPISEVESLSFGSIRLTKVPVGVFDMEQLMPGAGVDGFLSIGFFKENAFTVDYKQNVITLETDSSLKKIELAGAAIPIKIDRKGASSSIHLPLVLPNGMQISFQVDTGSQALILDERYMAALGIKGTDKDVRNKEGKDETGHVFNRFFTTLKGGVHLPEHPETKVDPINVMFQKIIHEGLVGHFFLREFDVTYDLKNSRMIFRKPAKSL